MEVYAEKSSGNIPCGEHTYSMVEGNFETEGRLKSRECGRRNDTTRNNWQSNLREQRRPVQQSHRVS